MGQKSEKEVVLRQVSLNRGVDKAQLSSESHVLSSSGQRQNVHKGTSSSPWLKLDLRGDKSPHRSFC